jgi:hypothetical protein
MFSGEGCVKLQCNSRRGVENYFYLDEGWGYFKVTAVPKMSRGEIKCFKNC